MRSAASVEGNLAMWMLASAELEAGVLGIGNPVGQALGAEVRLQASRSANVDASGGLDEKDAGRGLFWDPSR